MGNFCSCSFINYFYNEKTKSECLFGKRKSKEKLHQNPIPMCVITPLSIDYDIPVTKMVNNELVIGTIPITPLYNINPPHLIN